MNSLVQQQLNGKSNFPNDMPKKRHLQRQTYQQRGNATAEIKTTYFYLTITMGTQSINDRSLVIGGHIPQTGERCGTVNKWMQLLFKALQTHADT